MLLLLSLEVITIRCAIHWRLLSSLWVITIRCAIHGLLLLSLEVITIRCAIHWLLLLILWVITIRCAIHWLLLLQQLLNLLRPLHGILWSQYLMRHKTANSNVWWHNTISYMDVWRLRIRFFMNFTWISISSTSIWWQRLVYSLVLSSGCVVRRMTCIGTLLLEVLIGTHRSVSESVYRLSRCIITDTWLGLRIKITVTGYLWLRWNLAGHKRFVITVDRNIRLFIALIADKSRVKRTVVGINIGRINFPFLEVTKGLIQSF